ncbi:MAG: oligosaccharide repeat unit polymerase [Eubacterium sp.]|nr:oligosaccharide repeat unit polymerase [Eubacterium sp.]
MLKLSIIIVFLLLTLLFSYYSDNKCLFSPSFFFFGGFLASVIYAIKYVDIIELYMHFDTVFILITGFAVFAIVCIFINYTYKYLKQDYFITKYSGEEEKSVTDIYIEPWKHILMGAIGLFVAGAFSIYLLKISETNSISEAVHYWDTTNKFTEITLDIPSYISVLRLFSDAVCYIELYLLAHQLIYKYKSFRLMIIINIIIGIVNTALTGGRDGIIEIAFAMVFFLYFIYKDKYNWKRKINPKIIIGLIIVGVVAIIVFYFSAELMGRGKQRGLLDYICVYLSAELKNLDTFVREGKFGTDIAHSQTLANLRIYLAKRYGFVGWGEKLDIPFKEINGFGLGNVYTIFYMFLYDGGYKSLYFYTTIVAACSQLLFVFVRYSKRVNYSKINVALIIYAMISYAVLFSFFSNRFFELVLNVGFWRTNIIILVLAYLLQDFRFQNYDNVNCIRKYSLKKSYRI